MSTALKVANQAFKQKQCEAAQILCPQVEAIDARVPQLEMIVHSKLSELTTHINRLADRLDRSAV